MSLLTIIQRVCKQVGVTPPTAAYSSTDQTVIQMIELANLEGQDLASRHPWTVLQTRQTLTTIASESQGSLPSDFARGLNSTQWNRSRLIPLFGPLTPMQYEINRGQNLNNSFYSFRVLGGAMLIWPVPTAGMTFAYEYISKNWITTQPSGVTADSFTSDADTVLFDENLIIMGLRWRFLQAKGFEYATLYDLYEARVLEAMNADGFAPIVNSSINSLNDATPGSTGANYGANWDSTNDQWESI